jgi:CBS domain containing-hemolysin-like protein
MIYLFATFVFILLQAFYSGIETGLISIQKPRVNLGVKQNQKGAKILDFFLSRPSVMLSTCLLGTNICVVCASVMAKKTVESFGFNSKTGYLCASLLMTLSLLAAEIIPKNWFRQQPYQRCLRFSALLYASYWVLQFPAKMLSKLSDTVSKQFSKRRQTESNSKAIIREDFRLLLRESESADIIDSEAADILDRSIDFHSTKVGEICIKFKNVHSLPAATTIQEAIQFCNDNNCSRVPVFVSKPDSNQPSRWIGIFSVYDAIFNVPEEKWSTSSISRFIRPVTTIPANAALNEVIMQTNRRFSKTPLLVVIEPGDTSDKQLGIITPQDVVKRLFG